MPTTVTYGPTVVATPTPATTDGNALAFDTTALNVYDAQTGGTQLTALTAFGAGSVVSGQIVPDPATGAVGYQRSDGVVAVTWVEDPQTGVRYPVLPNEITSLVGGVSSIAVNGGSPQTGAVSITAGTYSKPGGGIPESDLDSTTSGKIDGAVQSTVVNLTGMVAGQLLQVNSGATAVTPVSIDTLGLVQDGDLPPDLHGLEFLAVGAPIPAGLTSETLIARVAAPTFGFTAVVGTVGASTVTSTTGVTVTTTTAIATGQKISIAIGASGEGTGAVSTWTVTTPTGISGAGLSNSHIQGTTGQTALLVSYATADVAAGATFTIKPDSARSDVCVIISAMTGVLQTGALDQTATNGGGAVTAFSVGPTATTTASSEIAIAAFSYNPGSPTTPTRVFGATGGWTQAGATVLSTDSSPRALAVVYLVLTSTQTVTASGSVTGTGGNTAYSATLATYKAA